MLPSCSFVLIVRVSIDVERRPAVGMALVFAGVNVYVHGEGDLDQSRILLLAGREADPEDVMRQAQSGGTCEGLDGR